MRRAVTSPIPGLVDGLVRITPAPDRTASLHLLISNGDGGQYDHVELVLAADNAYALALGLVNDRPQQTGIEAVLPCSVGVRLWRQG
jgi:hypothetical protein